MDNHGTDKYDLNKHMPSLAKEFDFAEKPNSQARQASTERAWSTISRFFDNCKKRVSVKKGQWVEYFGKVFGQATVAVPPHYTSQNCSNCGKQVVKTLSQKTHCCGHCGAVLDRDHNAALNILASGLNRVGQAQGTPAVASFQAVAQQLTFPLLSITPSHDRTAPS